MMANRISSGREEDQTSISSNPASCAEQHSGSQPALDADSGTPPLLMIIRRDVPVVAR
eukprot:COSAG01_NODE_2199_length_8180_cov_7.460262_8_plen_58_part_00